MRGWAFSLLAAAIVFVTVPAVADGLADGRYAGKRILHIDSYHQGNEWNDRIAAAVQDTLKDSGVELRIIRLDTKRNPSEAFAKAAAQKARKVIETFRPDVVTASDDNASKYLIMPFYKDASLPFVFCGVNWDASVYGFPYSNVTGMVEVSPIPQIVRLLRRYAKGDRIGYLTEDTPTKQKELAFHEKLFGLKYDKVYLVKDFAAWAAAYRRAQQEVDMLVILGIAAISDFDHDAAQRIAETETQIPSGTDFDWLMHFTMLGVGKIPEEQGRWSALAALKILDGVAPSDIPLTYNKEGRLYFNRTIARQLGISDFPPLAKFVQDRR